MKTAALIRAAKKRYPFLRETFIEIDQKSPAYGVFDTGYKPAVFETGGSITINVAELKDKWAHERQRFGQRFGKVQTFAQFVLVVLLHEIAHAKQYHERDRRELDVLYRIVDDQKTHDENPLEVEADKWARQELKKWRTK